MKVIFLDVDGVLTTCSYHNPDTNHIDSRRVWLLSQNSEPDRSKNRIDLHMENGI